MALTKEDIADIDSKAATKSDLEAALHEHTDEYPALSQITTDDKRSEMLERARGIVGDEELSDQDKADAIRQFLADSPDSVMVLTRQSYLRIVDSSRDESYTISMYKDMGSKYTSDWNAAIENKPVDVSKDKSVDHSSTKYPELDDAPEWAYPSLYDLIVGNHMKLLPTESKASSYTKRTKKTGVLADSTVPAYNEFHRSDRNPGNILRRANMKAKTGEQEAAWRILNEVVAGQEPLPMERRSSDPYAIYESELQRVMNRVDRFLKQPQRFTEDHPIEDAEDIDKPQFFSQLLRLEMNGWTAPRNNRQATNSGQPRPQVIRQLREMARNMGYEVVGYNVTPESSLLKNAQEDEMTTGLKDTEEEVSPYKTIGGELPDRPQPLPSR